MLVHAEMETRISLSHTILFFTVFQCLALDRIDFKIETVLQQKPYPLEEYERKVTRTCYDLCRQVCVSYHTTLLYNETIEERLQGQVSDKYGVIIVDEVFEMYQDSVVLIPSAMFSREVNNVSSQNVQTVSRLKELTTLQTAIELSSSLKDFIVLYLKQIRSKVIVVFHDDHTGSYVGDLLDHLSDQGVGVLVYSVHGQQNWTRWDQILTRIHKLLYTRGIYGLILGVPDTVLYTLKIINTFDGRSNRSTNFRHLSHWLVLTEVHSPDIYLPVVDKLENVGLVDIHTTKRPIIGISEVAVRVQSTVNTYFTSQSESHKCSSVQKLRTDLTGYIRTVFSRTPVNDNVTVWALTGIGNVSSFHEVEVLVPGTGSHLSDSLYPNKKYQWNGIHLVVSTKPWPGFVRKITHGNQTTYKGMCIDILKSMAEALNFTYTLEEVPDGEWGSITNGSWTGLVRQLQDRAIDLAVADVGIHSGRDTVMDYIYPSIKTEVIDILYRLHDDSDINLKRLTTLLTPIVLLIMAASFCAVTVLYVAVEHVDVVLQVRGRHRQLVITFWKVVWYLIGSILSQGGSENPRSCTGRLLLASWWLFSVIFAAMYSASLTVSFCVQRTVVPFTSLHDMVYDSDYKWGMFNGSINILHFGTSSNPLYKTTYTKMMEFAQTDPSVLSKDMDDQLEKVTNEKYAFISSRNSLNVIVQRAPKGVTLTTLGETIYPTSVSFGVPTDSPLLPELEHVMRYIKDSGLLQHWIDKYWNESRTSTSSFELGGDPLPLRKILNILCVIGFGVAVAITVLLCEGLLTIIRNRVKGKLKRLNDD